MAEKEKIQQQFNDIRKKYPQKLTQLSVKESLLQQCIQKLYLSQFQPIYNKKTKSNQATKKGNCKVLDQTDAKQKLLTNGTQQSMNTNLLQAIKIIVKAYQKNTSINQIYNFQNVQQMVEKTKITLKDIMKDQSLKSKPKNVQNVQQEVKKDEPQKVQKVSQQNIQPKSMPIVEKIQPAPVKPKSNSLFVQKQAPLSQKNIFKDIFKGPTNETRPSSRLLNQKFQNNILPEKPKSRSSAKSNRSRRSRVSSRGPQQNVPGQDEIEKKSQKQIQQKSEQKLSFQQNQIKVQRKVTLERKNDQKQFPYSDQQQEIPQSEQQIEVQKQPQPHKQQQQAQPQIKKLVFDHKNESIHLPAFKLSTQRPIVKKNPIESILTNPFIKKTFTHLCKQSYIGGGKTFDQIAQSADVMTLNKWMVFCKQFDFLSKLKKKQLVDIFQHCTSNKPQMNQQQFLDALIIVQNKLRVDQEDFIHQSMCLDSQFAFRQKVASFKINYSGPKKNFFQQSTWKPADKFYQNLRQAKYQQERKKQKQIILFQGKFKQQIQNELIDRKNQRQLKKSHLINSMMLEKIAKNANPKVSLSTSVDTKKVQTQVVKSPYLDYLQKKAITKANQSGLHRYENMQASKLKISRRIQPITYTEIFSQKNSNTTRAFTNEKKSSDVPIQQSKTKKISNGSKFIGNPPRAATELSKIKHKNNTQDLIGMRNRQTTQRKPEKAQQSRLNRQWTQQIKNWAKQFDKAQSQEDDEILREHLKRQKIKDSPLPQKMELSKIIQNYKKDQKWLQHNQQQDLHSEWDRETQLQTTSKKQRFR